MVFCKGEWFGCTKGVREEQGSEKKETMTVDALKIVALLGTFCCCLVFLFPLSFPHLLQVQKRRVNIQQCCDEARRMTDLRQPTSAVTCLCGIFIPLFVFLCTLGCQTNRPNIQFSRTNSGFSPLSDPFFVFV